MVILPLRAVGDVFVATVNAFDPLPLPLAGGVIVIQGTPLVAVQAHPVFVVIATLPGPPAPGIDRDVGRSETVQLGAGDGLVVPAAWLTCRSTPATVIVPPRAAVVFFEIATPTVPSPEPAAGGVRLIQPVLADAVQAHP